jgi:Na+/H+ antiporter NhaD/arsenite permease-like protein
MNASHQHGNSTPVAVGIVFVIAAYLAALWAGYPQAGTEMLLHGHADDHADVEHPEDDHAHDDDHAHNHALPDVGVETPETVPEEEVGQPRSETDDDHHGKPIPPPAFLAIPFVLLLGAIALFPLMSFTETWWESNFNRFLVAAGLASVTLTYYLVFHDQPVEQHWLGHGLVAPSEEGLNWDIFVTMLGNAIPNEYIPFIVLLFSLYVVCGGIRIAGNLRPTPGVNTAIMGVGALLASFIGTTGAAMLLIRLLLETNRHRKLQRLTVVFFIFTVCNCGGLLLPIGDPPLFLGYLRGVPFLWTMNLFVAWLLVNGMLLLTYYLWDRTMSFPKEDHPEVRGLTHEPHRVKFEGLWNYNFWFLIGIVLCVALLDPNKAVPGTDWHPPVFLREVLQLTFVLLSIVTTPDGVRQKNGFNYHAIVEVAALFIGIFFCMQPALQIIDYYGSQLPEFLRTQTGFFWVTGSLSSVLDNAPTYVVFFNTAAAITDPSTPGLVANTGVPPGLLAAISLGSVFMGAMTYIGNGPNFMVKAIAEASGVRMPSFLGYLVISCLVLLPILIIMNIIFVQTGLWFVQLFE